LDDLGLIVYRLAGKGPISVKPFALHKNFISALPLMY